MSGSIVAHQAGESKSCAVTEPQAFTIRCAECADELGTHLPDCPGVIAAGYDTAATGAFSATVYPQAGRGFGSHDSAIGALRFYLMMGPVELHLADGRVITLDDLGRATGAA